MAPSLADRILRHTHPGAHRGARSRHAVPAPAPRRPPAPEELARIRALFSEVTREWSGLEAAVEEFRKVLEPEDFEEALAAVGLSPLVTSLPGELAGEAEASAPAVPPAAPAAATAGRSRSRRRSEPGSGDGPAPAPGGAIHDKLSELLALLKENLAAKEAAPGIQQVEIPRNVTLEIAREVAGRVKESMLSTLKSAPAGSLQPEAATPPAPVEKRIPIGDVAGMIDQLTGGG